jgi:hypothetical protein
MKDRLNQPIVAALLSSLLTAAVFVGAPAIAHGVQHSLFAHRAGDAHKVDGKHAVGAKAPRRKRAGKLVATNRRGKLPFGILAAPPCPKGTILNENACIESQPRPAKTFLEALPICRAAGRRLPSPEELMSLGQSGVEIGGPDTSGLGIGEEYTNAQYIDDNGTSTVSWAETVSRQLSPGFSNAALSPWPFRCVEPLN